jgi:hypothetical protein
LLDAQLSPSPLDVDVIWAGTDDGNIQVTMDGGATWTNVTPPGIPAWTRIFNIEAGHFERGTAYAAANGMRIDDMHPHFWRTHDGGATWTEISEGLTPGAVANSIREDPRRQGLLYGATETQVWFSARVLVARLGGAGDAALRGEIEALAPAPRAGGGGRFGGAPAGPPTLNGTSQAPISAALAMQEADVAPTQRQVEACATARTGFEGVMAPWRALQARAPGD